MGSSVGALVAIYQMYSHTLPYPEGSGPIEKIVFNCFVLVASSWLGGQVFSHFGKIVGSASEVISPSHNYTVHTTGLSVVDSGLVIDAAV